MTLFFSTALGILIPFIGTGLGAAAVFFFHQTIHSGIQKALFGLAGGVMLAASVWSLLLPAIETASTVLPAALGFALGYGFFLLTDLFSLPRCPAKDPLAIGKRLALAVTLHNLPEGMAVGVVFAGIREGQEASALASALVLSVGIALQNIPEGAILSLPLKSAGVKRSRAFFWGAASGAVEPIGALIAYFLTRWIQPLLPWVLAFAAAAMVFVIVEELIPAFPGDKKVMGQLFFAFGFVLMMSLDVVLG